MDITVSENGDIIIDPSLLVGELLLLDNEPVRDRVMQSLACDDRVIKHVADQIIHGCTENGSHGYSGHTEEAPSTPLDRARRMVSLKAPDVATERIQNLERQLAKQRELANKWQEKAFEFYHAWPALARSRPSPDIRKG